MDIMVNNMELRNKELLNSFHLILVDENIEIPDVKTKFICINQNGYYVETCLNRLRSGATPHWLKNSRALENVTLYFKREGYEVLSDEYLGKGEPLVIKDNDGYMYYVSLDYFRQYRNKLNPFHMKRKFAELNIRVWEKNNNKSYKILEIDKSGKHLFVICECKECGRIWHTRFARLKDEGTGCKTCKNYNSPRSIEEIEEICTNYGYKLLSADGRLTKDYIHIVDSVGYKYRTTYSTLMQTGNVRIFDPRNPYVKENISLFLKLNGDMAEFIGDEYNGRLSSLKLKCKKCGCIWERNLDNLQKQVLCPDCYELDGGHYNKSSAREHRDNWINTDALVYTIRCFDDNEEFYKIGITTRSTKKRFCGKQALPYSYKVIHEIETSLYDAVFIEDELHELNKKYSYVPNIKFGGYTECFSQISGETYQIIKGYGEQYEYNNFKK